MKIKSKMECENISLKYESRRSSNSISILVVDDDTTCLSFVAALLKKLKYEVVTAKHPNDALCTLRIKGDAFDLVVSDVHMPDMNGFELQEAITHEFNLPVVLMSVDSEEVVVSKGMKSGAALFISKPVSPNDLKNLWQFASMRKKTSHFAIDVSASMVNEGKHSNPKRKPATKEGCEVNTKKPKVVWTNALHYRFLEAIRTIGLERSVPKKILEAMNVPGLTRENVASHLQKYRIFLKRVSDASYKLESGDDEGFIRRSCISNYSSPKTSNSLLMLNRLQEFADLPAPNTAPFSYQESPSMDQSQYQLIPITGGLQLLKPNITTAAVIHHHQIDTHAHTDDFDASSILGLNASSQVETQIVPALDSNCIDQTNYMGYNNIKHVSPVGLGFCDRDINSLSNELQNSIVSLDQLPQSLGDSSNMPDDHLPLDVPLIEGLDHFGIVHDEPAFCSMYDLPAFDIMATQQPLRATDHDSHHSDQKNTQNLVKNGCDYYASSLFNGGMNNSFYDQALYQGEDEDILESLLAFGEDQMQTLEGI